MIVICCSDFQEYDFESLLHGIDFRGIIENSTVLVFIEMRDSHPMKKEKW